MLKKGEETLFDKDISIVLSGEAGQGLNTIESLLITMLTRSGKQAFLSKEFMSRVRGGNNTTEIRVSSESVYAFVNRIDLLIVLSRNGMERLENRLSPATLIIGEAGNIPQKYADIGGRIIPIDFSAALADLGGSLFLNSYIFGMLAGLLSCNSEVAKSLIQDQFQAKGDDIVGKNLLAFQRGSELSGNMAIPISIETNASVVDRIALNGTEAVAIGAIAGGCNFIASYPMSPSTGVLVNLAKRSEAYDIAVEQAEDEIAAINMMLGAWYAGARAMVTTSGGGFALMTEGMSLAGCIESPAVIHLAQRPGPATGLPTRTEQGDLNLALYAGHGDYPRVIYAPGHLADGVMLSRKAFEVADQYQVPVILLTDQFFLDSIGTIDKSIFSESTLVNHIVETAPDYNRYAMTPSGISPRGIPGYGHGLVCVDSDEHSENGRITEDFNIRTAMVDKRMRKLAEYEDIEPELIGHPDYSILIIGWGSTYGVICEALKRLQRSDIAFAYFKQVYPLPTGTKELMERAKIRISVENNATGQFAGLLKMETLLDIQFNLLKYNGMPFSVEELTTRISGTLSI
ncbi:MAG: 2-oxoacid:ferredoxin oxidoreductase subunit alpha [Elusimicrobia bacterium RIFOXYB2_FULL_49_7]|nr:MAG: 2-oxoacid:ferredoxin oxidoreductase subunit alpha [Elusimicrobia bacterium RIFOXYB2_FULL_49_7]